jgi:D-lactate dehydrogenase (cytochrome)
VITELTVRLHGVPESEIALRAAFPTLEAASRCATALVASGVAVLRVELVDAATVSAVNAYKGTSYDAAPSLWIALAGAEAAIAGDLASVRELAEWEGCTELQVEREEEARRRLWDARHHVLFALVHGSPGKLHRATDVCVPVSELPDAIAHARSLAESLALDAAVVAHAGDGNYHVLFMLDPADPSELERAEALSGELVRHALARGGTCTGEHGVGLGKIGYLEEEHADLVPLMRDLKRMLDPNGILNPGKVVRWSE